MLKALILAAFMLGANHSHLATRDEVLRQVKLDFLQQCTKPQIECSYKISAHKDGWAVSITTLSTLAEGRSVIPISSPLYIYSPEGKLLRNVPSL
jgi:hypothetical protein